MVIWFLSAKREETVCIKGNTGGGGGGGGGGNMPLGSCIRSVGAGGVEEYSERGYDCL